MATVDEARRVLGQLFITGIKGFTLSDESASFLSQANIGGVILFTHNYQSAEQIAELINQIQECRVDLPLWICVDQEGGRVQRFKKPFTRLPVAAEVGKLNSPKITFELAEMMARELKTVGVNVNFCPVADIHTNPANPIIGDRAYGTDEDTVSKIVSAMVRGHIIAGVQPCLKHFPGHGDTSVDSHLALPSIDTPLKTLQEREFKPFTKGFKSRCSMVMTAHIVHSILEPKLPATFSKKFLKDYLRGELRYSKLIVSDDLEMAAITDHFGADEAPRLAVEAGCDLLIYRSEKASRHAYAILDRDLVDGKLDPTIILEAAQRIDDTKRDALLPYAPTQPKEVAHALGTPEHQAIVAHFPAPADQKDPTHHTPKA